MSNGVGGPGCGDRSCRHRQDTYRCSHSDDTGLAPVRYPLSQEARELPRDARSMLPYLAGLVVVVNDGELDGGDCVAMGTVLDG